MSNRGVTKLRAGGVSAGPLNIGGKWAAVKQEALTVTMMPAWRNW